MFSLLGLQKNVGLLVKILYFINMIKLKELVFIWGAHVETFHMETKEHLNLEHTLVLKQSICMLIAKRPISLSKTFIKILYLWKKHPPLMKITVQTKSSKIDQ